MALFELLIAALQSKFGGSFVLERSGGRKTAITLTRGGVSKMKLSKVVHPIGEVCVDMGFIRRPQLEEVLRAKRTGPLGEMLVESGKMSRSQLQEALREQLLRQMAWASRLPPNTVYGCYPGRDFLAAWKGGPSEIDPLAVIWAAISGAELNEAAVSRKLAHFEGRGLKLHPHSAVARFGFSPKQRSLVNVLRVKAMELTDFTDCGIVTTSEAQKVALALIMTRHVDTGEGKAPLGVEESDSDSASGSGHHLLDQLVAKSRQTSSSPAPAGGRRGEILQRAQQIGSLDYYAIFGLPTDAPTSTIQAEFFRQAKVWHPDRLPADLSDLKDQVTHIFARMTEAHQTLTNPAQRKEYDDRLHSGVDGESEAEQVQAALNAANLFNKAEICVKRNEWTMALENAAKACVEDPDQPEYEALHAWLLARLVKSDDRKSYMPMLERLVKAVKQQPDNVRVRTYRARVLKLAGMTNEALRDYKAIADEDNSHLEAKRELRLFKMRGSGDDDGGDDKSILGRFFKR